MLITRPNHDVTTDYLYFWSKLVINYAAKTKRTIIDLLKKRANYKEFNSYDDDFVFSIENDKVTRPLQDKTAEIFLKPSNQIAILLLKGNTTGESCKRSKELYRKQILGYMTSEATTEQKELIPLLLWDHDHQVCLGDQTARI